MRLRGGFAGILAALATGRLDPLHAGDDEDRRSRKLTAANRRQMDRRAERRAKRLANRAPF